MMSDKDTYEEMYPYIRELIWIMIFIDLEKTYDKVPREYFGGQWQMTFPKNID